MNSPTTGKNYDVSYMTSGDGCVVPATKVNAYTSDGNGSNDITFASYLAEASD